MAGTIYSAELPNSGQRRIEGFNPATDKLDLGGVSVHSFIVVDTPEGVAFMDPWSGTQTLIAGVSLGQLTVDSFVPVENDHLRQDLSGALAWEHGITQAPNTVYARSHEVGQIDRVAFDPATDVVDFRYYGTREQLYMVDGTEGVVIGNYTTGQTLILLDTTVAELSPENFLFHFAQAREDRLWLQLGFDQIPDSQVIGRDDIPTVGTNNWPTAAGPGAPPNGEMGTTYEIDWDYGVNVVLDFDPATDKLDFRYFRPNEFTVAEVNGSVVISIVGQNQTYTLNGVSLAELDYNNIVAVEDATYQKWRGLIEEAHAGAPDEPTLRVADALVTEGDAGQTVMNFTVTLSKAAAGVVTVDYSTLNGTALAGSDYQAAIGALTFQPGETTKTVQVAIIGDTSFEFDERFDLVLSSPEGATLADERAAGTILNDDAQAGVPPAISIADLSIAEGDGTHVHFMFMVTLDKASTEPVTVEYHTMNGTALAGADYASTTGTITFAPGETAKQLHVDVVGDFVVEPNESFTVMLTAPSGATIAAGTAIGTILNDDEDTNEPAPGGDEMVFKVNDNWGAGFVGQMTLTPEQALNGWTIEFDAPFDISNIWNAEIVSHVGDHYVIKNAPWNGKVPADGEVTFGFQASPGGTNVTVDDFVVNGRPVGEHPHEPELPTLTVADASVTEGHAGTSTLTFTVTLSQAATSAVTVNYATANGTATAGQDYTALAGTLTFAAGETSKTIQVAVNGDTQVEPNEALTLILSSPSGATIADGSASGTILNDDAAVVPPAISIADLSLAEGNGEHVHFMFTVTLDKASTSPVTVQYSTANGTAVAGSDYAATTGSLTFAPGETTKQIHVDVIGDQAVEPNETFTVTLSNASGGTIADGSATGTILNDDIAPPPVISVSNTSVVEGDPGSGGVADGWYSTSGNQIVDSAGNPVKIAGVNWFGFETTNAAPHGLWTRSYQDMMDQMLELGFNTIRLPFSTDMLHATTAQGIDYSKNPDLVGLTPLEIMDKIVEYADEIGIKIILDHHRSSLGNGPSENGLWYDSSHSEQQWIDDWQMLAERYADNPSVIGADLHNEPHNGVWGGGGANDWPAAAERAGNAIGKVNENWLIIVEGVGSYQGESYWWGGNLMGVADRPVELDVPNKLVYSPHDYGNSVYAQPWFQDPNFAEDLPAKFDEMWGYIYREGIAPVLVGEFGTKLQDPKDEPWLEALTSYMAGDFDNDGTIDLEPGEVGISWTYWSWNPNSSDTGGILADDWITVIAEKMAYLEPIQFDLGDVEGGDAGAYAVFTITLSAAAAEAVSVNYHTMPGDAGASDFTAVSGSLTFAPGETSKTIKVAITGDTLVEGDDHFTLMLTDANGAVLGAAEGIATIIDDDEAAPPVMPSLSVDDAGANEGSAAVPGFLTFTVSLSEAADGPVSVSYATANGSALAGQDYQAQSGTLTFAAGETVKTVQVALIGDGVAEANETLTLMLTSPSGATIADGSGRGTLQNDDVATPPPAGGDEVAFKVNDNWGAGFVGQMTLTPEQALNGWTLEFDAQFDISNIWNAEIVSHVGDHYVIKNAPWNGKVPADGTVTFGFQASPGGAGLTAEDFVVNGRPVGEQADVLQMAAVAPLSDDVIDASIALVDSDADSFTAEVTVHNDGEARTGWMLAIKTLVEIAEIHGAEIASRDEAGYVVRNIASNADLGHDRDVRFEIVGRGSFDGSQFDFMV